MENEKKKKQNKKNKEDHSFYYSYYADKASSLYKEFFRSFTLYFSTKLHMVCQILLCCLYETKKPFIFTPIISKYATWGI